MGRLVTLNDLPHAGSGGDVVRAGITRDDMHQMAAELIKIAPAAEWTDTSPAGSDAYLFVTQGAGTLIAMGHKHALPTQSFATIKEHTSFLVNNDSSEPMELVMVIAPPHAGALAGYTEDVVVAERASIPFVGIPEQHKRRQYIVGSHAAKTDRAHAMIVTYVGNTETGMHHHPDAESMFVLLDGTLDFVVNGETVRVAPGQVTYFGMNDAHALRPSAGVDHVAFLEFHVPAGFSTVKHAA